MMLIRLSFLIVLLLAGFVAADEAASKDQSAADKKALAAIRVYVGGWRGVGLAGSDAKEGWGEEAQWAWEFDKGRAAIVFDAPEGRIYKAGKILPGDKPGTFAFTGTLPDGKTTETFTGKAGEEGELTLEADKPADGRPVQITLRTVAKGKRLIITYRRKSVTGQLATLAEVGYTRKGSNFAGGGKANECVVTGGEGDIRVTYKGETFYVCCRGCQIEFNENPDKVMTEYRARKAEEAKKRADK